MLRFRFGLIQPSTSSLFMCECEHGLNSSSMHLVRCSFKSQRITTHDTIWNVMYVLAQKSGHDIWKERWYAFTSKVSLQADLYMTWKDQVFVADVVVTDPTQKTVASNVISWPVGVIVKLNTIAQIRKYRRLREGHHFISMGMEVHDALGHDMNHFIKECARLSLDRWSKCHLSLSFCIQFFKQHFSIVLQCALASTIERKIMFVTNVCSRPPITIKSHNLHVGDIRKGCECNSFLPWEGLALSFFLRFLWAVYVMGFLWPSLSVFHVMVPAIKFLLDFGSSSMELLTSSQSTIGKYPIINIFFYLII